MARRGETPRTWTTVLKGQARRFHEEEEGATLVFAAATFFALTMSIAFVLQIGFVSADRLQMQGAADAAAYSGALVEANSLNAMGQINDGLTYVNYIVMRHTLDVIVYTLTLDQYTWNDRRPPATGAHGYAIMGGRSQTFEGNARIAHMRPLVSGTQVNLLRWRSEINEAARVVLKATPGLVRTTASEVAKANGASHIGFSDDLEKAWQVGDGETDGFTEKGYLNDDDHYGPSLYERYEGRKVLHITEAGGGKTAKAETRILPRPGGWFDATKAEMNADYYQVRLCWRKEDWDHKEGERGGDHGLPPYTRYRRGDTPNAHWHHGHVHQGEDLASQTGFPVRLPHVPENSAQFLDPGGHQEDTQAIHANPSLPLHRVFDRWLPTIRHHAVRACRCCNIPGGDRQLSPSPDTPGASRYAEIMATTARSQVRGFLDTFKKNLNVERPSPLLLREPLLRSALTVAVYRRSRGLGDLFPESPWGMIGVASAQVGVETANGVTPLKTMSNGKADYAGGPSVPYWDEGGASNTAADRRKNLFYDVPGGADGFQFSARLVPIARKLTWQKDAGKGESLERLLEGQNWYPAGKLAPGTPPTAFTKVAPLSQYLKVETRADLEAFWH